MHNDQPGNRHHFLFHIFRMDKKENPMPQQRAETLLQHIKRVCTEQKKRST